MARWSDNPDFDLFRLPDEHNELRGVLRDLCEKEIEPYAADVDEHGRYPRRWPPSVRWVRCHPFRGVRRVGWGFRSRVHRDRRGRARVRPSR
jgi:hypothetical protein